MNLYTDDTTIYFSSKDPQEVQEVLEAELGAVAHWIKRNQLKMNGSKTQLMVLSRRRRKCEAERIRIQLDGSILVSEEKVRYLGVDIDRNLTWKDQVCKVRRSCLSSLARLSRVSSFLPFETKKRLYNALVLPHMDYCCVVWMECGAALRHEIKRLQNYGMWLITSSPRLACSAMLRSRLSWVPLEQRRRLFRLALVHKCLLGRAPQYLCSKFVTNESLGLRTTRGSSNLYLKRPTTNFYLNIRVLLTGITFQIISRLFAQKLPLKVMYRIFFLVSC